MFRGQFGMQRPGYDLDTVVANINGAPDARMYVAPASSLGRKVYDSLINLGFTSCTEFETEYLVWSRK